MVSGISSGKQRWDRFLPQCDRSRLPATTAFGISPCACAQRLETPRKPAAAQNCSSDSLTRHFAKSLFSDYPFISMQHRMQSMTLRILLTVTLALAAVAPRVNAQSTIITYNGQLNDNGSAATGLYDVRFSLYDSANGGLQIGASVTQTASVKSGLFTSQLDFGMNFSGADRWMQLEVRKSGIGANFVILDPRQRITAAPYSTYSLSAATASDVASSTVVRSLNALKDDVILQAGANVSITPSANTLTISAASGGGSSIWSLLNNNAYFNVGNVGIGTSAPLVPLEVNGITRSTRSGAAAQYIQLDGGDPAGIRITARSVVSAEKSLTIQNFSGETTPGVNNSIQFALGTPTAPSTKMTITKDGNVLLPLGGTGGSIQFGTPNFETGMTIAGANRADIRFDGAALKLIAGPGGAIPSAANGILINTAGNVGIGSLTPQAKLEVVSQDALRLVGYQPFLTLLDSNAGYARSRIQGVNGDIVLEPESYVSGANPSAWVTIAGSGNVSVEMSATQVAAGSVVIIDSENAGKLKLSDQPYDARVAGVVSGARGINPGIALHQEGALEGGQNVALSGRVYVLADADYGVIRPGDLLTTSGTPGHAMKVVDHARAQGAILGKAMSSLKNGQGTVLVLVTLQ